MTSGALGHSTDASSKNPVFATNSGGRTRRIVEQTESDYAPLWERSESQPAVGCPLEHAPINYFLAAVVATRTLWSTAMALFYFDRYSENMIGKLLIIVAVISGVILTVMFNTTTPATAGAFGILAVFVFAYLLIASGITFLLYGTSRMVSYVIGSVHDSRRAEVLTLQKSYYYSTIVSLAPIIIISMQSVGSVGVYEFALIMILVLLGCIYISKRTT